MSKKATSFSYFLEEYPELDEKLEEINKVVSNIEESNEKADISLASLNSKRKEIERFYQNLFGYKEENEEGKENHTAGIKDHLEETYNNLEEKINNSEAQIEELVNKYKFEFSRFKETQETNHQDITNKMESLLTNALTAGLSAAFSKKKEQEEKPVGHLTKKG